MLENTLPVAGIFTEIIKTHREKEKKMLINTINFEIHDYKTQTFGEFMMENTIANQEMVFTHRFTRNITFGKEFDFDFEKKMSAPLEFIDERILAAIVLNSELDIEATGHVLVKELADEYGINSNELDPNYF